MNCGPQAGREAGPSATIMNSQSVKTSSVAEERGCDGAELVTERKHHPLVDGLSLLLAIYVHPANVSECAGLNYCLTAPKARAFPTCSQPGPMTDMAGCPGCLGNACNG